MTQSDLKVMSPTKGLQLKQDAKSLASEIQSMLTEGKGLSAIGFSRNIYGWAMSRISGTNAKKMMNSIDGLKSLLSLDNIKYLKGQGAISDAERLTLEQASSRLNAGLKEEDFQKELDRIRAALSQPAPENPSALRQQFEQSQTNQVKGMQQQNIIGKMPTIQMDNKKVALLPQVYPQGSTGGQCGVWVRSIVERQGLTYPRVGDTLTEKARTVQKYGLPITQARPGSVLITAENKKTGHVAYVLARTAQGVYVAESNYGLNGKVSYGRFIPFNSPIALGVINPTRA
jgi:surface antigen